MIYTYAFIGLPPFERALLDSIFKLDADQSDRLVAVTKPDEAHLLILNADDRDGARGIAESRNRGLTVLVGEPISGLDLPTIRRPLSLESVVRVLGRLEWPEGIESQFPSGPVSLMPPNTMAPETSQPPPEDDDEEMSEESGSAFARTTASAPMPPRAVVVDEPPWPPHRPTAPPATALGDTDLRPTTLVNPLAQEVADVLVVARLGSRQHTLPRGLRRLGYRVQVVEGDVAARHAFELGLHPFVFLDQASLGEDLLPLCRALTEHRTSPDQPPYLAVIARRKSVLDRVRARAAGCNAWMQVPIDRDRLIAYFAKRGLRPSR